MQVFVVLKRAVVHMTLLVLVFSATAQGQIKSLPKTGYEKRIREYVDNMKVVDTHEHLMSVESLLKERYPDFMMLLRDYIGDDLHSSGMPYNDGIWTGSMTVYEKWQIVKPFWEATSNTAYCRAALLAADKLFGVKNIDSVTVELLSERIKQSYLHPNDWFYQVLKEKSRIEYVVLDNWHVHDDPSWDRLTFRYVYNLVHENNIYSKADIENFPNWKDTGAKTFDDLVAASEKGLNDAINQKHVVALKSWNAYQRTISYEDVTKAQAEFVFNKIMNASDETKFSLAEVKPLQDYLMHNSMVFANDHHFPVQIHTGLLAGNGNLIENSKPTLLVNLFQKYPNVKFILFHGGYPYGGELATLAKNFRNVYIDMCWLYIISPSFAERYLHEWLETVPANKIMAFGGDFRNVEGVYSHLLMTKQVVSNVLVAKVKDGYFTEAEALKIAQMILHDNAVRVLNLK